MNDNDKEFLLRSYGEEYGPDAGPWNTSVKSKYLEYRLAAFFEEHFAVGENDTVCNIGIGAGSWDRYLSYRLKGGRLTSIDRDPECCRQLELRLENEQNPNAMQVICSDVLSVENLDRRFAVVTMVGSTRLESGLFEKILRKALHLVKPGGSFYYQTLDKSEEKEYFSEICRKSGATIEAYQIDTRYNMKAQFFKAVIGQNPM